MKRFNSFLFLLVVLAVGSTSVYAGEGNGCRNRCGDAINNVDKSKTYNQGGKGGDASANSRSNSSSSSKSKSKSSSSSSASQGQSQVGVNVQKGSITNSGPQVVIEETYEAAANVTSAYGSAWDCGDVVGLSGSVLIGGGSVAIPVNNETCVDMFVLKNAMHYGNVATKVKAQDWLGQMLSDRAAAYAVRAGGYPVAPTSTPDN